MRVAGALGWAWILLATAASSSPAAAGRARGCTDLLGGNSARVSLGAIVP